MGLGAPGGTGPGGESGIGSSIGLSGGGGLGAFLGNLFSGFNSQEAIDNMMLLTMPTMLMQGLLYAGSGKTFGDIAQGDPSFSPGVVGPNGNGAQGGGPGIFQLPTLAKPAEPVMPPAPIEAPLPNLKPIRPPKRKRIGRQETILTSGLAEVPSYKPTLLGQ